jgi:hypothetical protein
MQMLRRIIESTVVLVGLMVCPAFSSQNSESNLLRVNRAMLCVTEGSVDENSAHLLSVDASKMRAYVNRNTLQTVEAHFKYVGATEVESKLGSGEVRRQFGLKLRAEDPCNLIYVMWRIAPESKLVVSVKTNPGQRTSAECGNRGYKNIKPTRSSPVPVLQPGVAHTLRAELNGDALRVLADGAVVWTGNLGAEARGLNGPVGMRSDNARLETNLRVAMPPGAHPDFVLPCKSGPAEAE